MTGKSPQEYIEEAARHSGADRRDQVGETLEEGLRSHPRSAELLSHLGYFYYATGRHGRAIRVFERLADLQPPDASVCLWMEEILRRRGRRAEANAWLRRIPARSRPEGTRFRIPKNTLLGAAAKLAKFAGNAPPTRIIHALFERPAAWIALAAVWLIETASRGERSRGRRGYQLLRFLRAFAPDFYRRELAYHKFRELLLCGSRLADAGKGVLLDIGTGRNPALLFWSRMGFAPVALDGSAYGTDALREVARRMEDAGAAVPLAQTVGDALRLPIADNAAGAVTSICAIEHFTGDGDIRASREMFRVLKPGGRAVITFEAGPWLWETWIEAPYERGYQSGSGEEEEDGWREVFCRHYDSGAAERRIANAAPWILRELRFYDDGRLPVRAWMDPALHPFLSRILRPFAPAASSLFFRERPFPNTLSFSAVGCMVLEKPFVQSCENGGRGFEPGPRGGTI